MKRILAAFLFLIPIAVFSQNDCTYTQNATDSLGTYKSLKEYVMHERNFGSSSAYLFFSLAQDNGTPLVNVQYIQKSSDFMKAACFDKSSKIYLQLDNGKIITLLHAGPDACGTMIPLPEEGKNTRVLTGSFVFLKGNFEELEASPLNIVRIKFTTETLDFPMKKVLVSELTKEAYGPSSYFIDYLKCVK